MSPGTPLIEKEGFFAPRVDLLYVLVAVLSRCCLAGVGLTSDFFREAFADTGSKPLCWTALLVEGRVLKE